MRPLLMLPFAFAALALPALAALSPQAQRKAEIMAILDSTAVQDGIGARPIDAIRYVEPDHYRIDADDCILSIKIVGLPSGPAPGSRRFTVTVPDQSCR